MNPILIEDNNRKETFKAKQLVLNANLVQSQNNKNNRSINKSQGNDPNFKKKKSCYFTCGKPSHHTVQCRRRVRNDNEKGYPPKANLVEGDEIIAAVVSQVNLVAHVKEWAVDSRLLETSVQIEKHMPPIYQ